MSPLRILVLIILFYIGFRLIFGGKKKKPADVRSDRPVGSIPSNDTLEEDPVCNKLVPRQQALSVEHHGSTIYFCSKECCEKFKKINGENR